MNKGKNVQALILVLVLSFASHGQLLASARKTSFEVCFKDCSIQCLTVRVRQRLLCALACFGKCISSMSPLELDYCKPKPGCGVDQCARLITNDFEKEDIDKVVNCVSGCGEIEGKCRVSDQPNASTNGAPSPIDS